MYIGTYTRDQTGDTAVGWTPGNIAFTHPGSVETNDEATNSGFKPRSHISLLVFLIYLGFYLIYSLNRKPILDLETKRNSYTFGRWLDL